MKNRILFGVFNILFISLTLASPSLAAKKYHAERFDVTLAVQPDGALIVSETVVFRFEGGPFTYVFRDLRYTNLDVIDRLQASMDGQVLPQGQQPGQVEIVPGKPLKVTWHFSPTSDSTHEFTLVYRVQGAIRKTVKADTLIWRAIPEEHDYTIAQSQIRLEYPAGLAPQQIPTLSGSNATYEESSQYAIFTTANISKDTAIDITVHFPPNSLLGAAPAWQVQQEEKSQRARAAIPYGAGSALITGLVSLVGLIIAALGFRRDKSAFNDSPDYTTPPSIIPAALAARLIGTSMAPLGTLFNLAHRGLLRIEEGPKKWGSTTFEVLRLPSSERLKPHEKIFMETLFRAPQIERVDLSDISALAANNRFLNALDQELIAAGWYDPERSAGRNRYLAFCGLILAIGLALLLIGLVIYFIYADAFPWAATAGAILLGAGAAACLISLVGMIIGYTISPLSEEGLRQAAAWRSFARYLGSVTAGRETQPAPDIFERYLPYAAAFGMAVAWGKFFQNYSNLSIPAWFKNLSPAGDDGGIVALMSAISSADSSASGAGGGDGGGGAAGGGASGAG